MAIEVVEAKLVSALSSIFTPIAVSTMSAEIVTEIAGESEEDRTEREQLSRQLHVLRKGSVTCKRFIGARVLGM